VAAASVGVPAAALRGSVRIDADISDDKQIAM
jgi:hypothetical protein